MIGAMNKIVPAFPQRDISAHFLIETIDVLSTSRTSIKEGHEECRYRKQENREEYQMSLERKRQHPEDERKLFDSET